MTASLKSLNVPDPAKVYRVVQWATGRIGETTLRELITSPQFDLVGVYVHSPAKDGKDAGELCGLPHCGVAATRDIDAIIALKPDCVVAVQDRANVDDVCRVLEAGINIATSRVDYLDPAYMDPDVRSRTEAACRKGGASIHASGSSPGFSSEAMPLVMTSMSRRMDRMVVDEFADFTASMPDRQILETGFGRDAQGEFDPGILHHISQGFYQSVHVVATALGVELDDISASAEMAGARESFLLPGGTRIEKGKVAAQRISVTGMRNGQPWIQFRVNWYISTDVDADWDLRENGWRLVIEGDTPIEANISFPVSDDRRSAAMAGLTAYRVVNAIPFVCAAEPGIRTSIELPAIVPRMG